MRAISREAKTFESTEIRVGNGIQGELGLSSSSLFFSIPTNQNTPIILKITKHHGKIKTHKHQCMFWIQNGYPPLKEGTLKLITYAGKT